MSIVEIEFNNKTRVLTENGVEFLVDLLGRPVELSLWALKWTLNGVPNGISFHKSHKVAKAFAAAQIDSVPESPARLVEVSDWLYNKVQKCQYYWTNMNDFEEAKTYGGEKWNH